MPRFKYDPALGSFKSWLLLITRRRIADHLKNSIAGHKSKGTFPGKRAGRTRSNGYLIR